MTQPNDFAYPSNIIDPDGRFQPEYNTGLTKREYFAAMAMQGMIANGVTIDVDKDYVFKTRAQTCIIMADALIKALNQTPTP